MRRRRLTAMIVAGAVLLGAALVAVVIATGSGSGELVIYSARSHYGEEKPFNNFASDRGIDLTLFGGTASELYERLKSEGDATRADVLITVDAANLWRAEQAHLLLPVHSAKLDRNVPRDLRDPDGEWFGLTQRARTIVRSTKRVRPDAVTTYEGLGDPRWKGRLCLRSGTSEYNVSFVADRLAKDGPAATERMLRRWMANDPEILGADTDVLHAIAENRCDVGLVNSYYLGRELKTNPGFPVALVWADQQGRGTHVNLSGYGIVRATDRRQEALELIEFLSQANEQRTFARNNDEFPVHPGVPVSPEIARFGRFKRDPIDVKGAGEHLSEAVKLMNEIGWQ